MIVTLGSRQITIAVLSRYDAAVLQAAADRHELAALRAGLDVAHVRASLLGRVGVGLPPHKDETWTAHGERNLRHLMDELGWTSFAEVSAMSILAIETLTGTGDAGEAQAQAVQDFWQARTEKARSRLLSSPSGRDTHPPGQHAPGPPRTSPS